MCVDGIILDTCIGESQRDDYLAFLKGFRHGNGKRLPMVLIERTLGSSLFGSVVIDNYSAAYEAVKYLIDIGRKKIVCYTSDYDWDILRERKDGYVQAMKDNGLEEFICLRTGNIKAGEGYGITLKLSNEVAGFDAIFTANDQMAIGVLKALGELNISVPGDVAVMGFDNISAASIVTPSLSTVDVPRFKMGYQSVAWLVKQMESSESKHEKIVLNTKLVIRESTDTKKVGGWDFGEF